jgi:hypothetical protein
MLSEVTWVTRSGKRPAADRSGWRLRNDPKQQTDSGRALSFQKPSARGWERANVEAVMVSRRLMPFGALEWRP